MYYLIMPTPERRTQFIDYLRERGILAVFHYSPLHLSSMGRSFGFGSGDCPVTEQTSDRLVRLPFYNDLNDDDLSYVISSVISFQ